MWDSLGLRLMKLMRFSEERGPQSKVLTYFVTAETTILQHDKVPFFPHLHRMHLPVFVENQ